MSTLRKSGMLTKVQALLALSGSRPGSGWKLGFGATCYRSPIRPAVRAGLTPPYAASLYLSSTDMSMASAETVFAASTIRIRRSPSI